MLRRPVIVMFGYPSARPSVPAVSGRFVPWVLRNLPLLAQILYNLRVSLHSENGAGLLFDFAGHLI